MLTYLKYWIFVSFLVLLPLWINAQALPIEDRLLNINVTLTEVPNHEEQVRELLLSDPAYKKLADNILTVVGNRKIMHKTPLEVINGKFKALLGKSYNDYVTHDHYDNLYLIKKAVYKTWKERHIDSSRSDFSNILIDAKQEINTDKQVGTIINIIVEYPKKSDKIPLADFIGKGKIISKIELIEDLYIYSCIKTDKYYRQDSQKLSFSNVGSKWVAPWELDLVLGRPADIGLEGLLYLFVVDKNNRKSLVKYYMYPRDNMHSSSEIISKASLEWTIERSIPN